MIGKSAHAMFRNWRVQIYILKRKREKKRVKKRGIDEEKEDLSSWIQFSIPGEIGRLSPD